MMAHDDLDGIDTARLGRIYDAAGDDVPESLDTVEELLRREKQERRAHESEPPRDPPPADDAPPPTDESDAAGDSSPAAPWKGGDEGPLRMANDFIARFYRHPDGITLHKWRGDFYRWSPEIASHAQLTDDELDGLIYRKLRLKRPSQVRDVRAALVGVDDVVIDHAELGSWIGAPTVAHPPLELAPCRNGLLHLPTSALYPATPRYFTTAPLGVGFDPRAPQPEQWLGFLKQLWPDDSDSIAALQEWFGYQLTPDTRQQKILMLIGKRRSGKGTIARILTALLGKDSVVAPTLASLGTNFGLWTWIGKTAAIIADARLGGRNDIAQVVERLLNLSGEDAQTVDRKHRLPWTGRLSARVMIISNELPKFTDASDALSGRMLILKLTQSFYGQEDPDLSDKLIGSHKFPGELPGILLWAIEGWKRLRKRGHFVQPKSSAHLISDLEDLASPVRAWVRERCVRASEVTDDDVKRAAAKRAACWVLCDGAYGDFTTWCKDQGQEVVPTKTRFGIDLGTIGDIVKARATTDQVEQLRGNPGQNPGQKRPWVYKGIRLRELADDAVS